VAELDLEVVEGGCPNQGLEQRESASECIAFRFCTSDRYLLVVALSVVDPDLQVNSGGSYIGMSKLLLQVVERDTGI
jgi:hypothetical protein